MTPKAQQIAIAKVRGWKEITNLNWIPLGIPPTRRHGVEYIPNYPKDLNAIRSALELLEGNQIEQYVNHLCDVLDFSPHEEWTEYDVFNFSQATAAEMAQAFLLTIGKWEGGAE